MLGVFDSGVGGLTVVAEIKKRFPKRGIIYLGDTARVPYGPRGVGVIKQFAIEDARFLKEKGVSEIVVACNTVSALALDEVRATVDVSVTGVIEPAVKMAKAMTKNSKIGVIGTRGTIGSRAYAKALRGFGVIEQSCPLLVPFIEEGEEKNPALKLLLEDYLKPMRIAGVDTLILGCTHYPVIFEQIQYVLPGVKLVHCGVAVASELLESYEIGVDHYYVTDLNERVEKIAERFLGEHIKIEQVQL